MIDPAHIAQADQVQAAFRTWAECLRIAWMEIMKMNVPQERALDIAQEWVALSIAHLGMRDV